MQGLGGDDAYVVDDAGDLAIENAGQGFDGVWSSVSYVLGANLEYLFLLGGNTDGTGNELANTLWGSAGANTLDGRGGADVMGGGAGNDTYVVDQAGDSLQEFADDGIDTVKASLSWTLGANLENLVLTGSAAIDGTGNALANRMLGNDASNILVGGGGNDELNGMGGNDTLEGGAGDDTYAFDRGSGSDIVIDTGKGDSDVGQFGSGIAIDQLWFSRSRFDLQVQLIGTADSLTVQDWYKGSGSNRLDLFQTTDGRVLTEARVQNLVNAMASFAPPPAGQTTLSPAYQAALGATIAANWQ